MANALKNFWTPEETINKMYDRLFDTDNVGYLQQLVDTIDIDENSNFWTEHFVVEGNEYDIDLADTKKNPAWTVRQRDIRVVPMADPMAPLSETRQLETEGFGEQTGSIYGYGKGLFETSMSKQALQAQLAQMSPEDRSLVTAMQRGIADLIKTHNLRLSNMAAMTLSYGGAYNTTTAQDATGTMTTQGGSGVVVSQRAFLWQTLRGLVLRFGLTRLATFLLRCRSWSTSSRLPTTSTSQLRSSGIFPMTSLSTFC